MPVNTKAIKNRIKSVKNTKKITKAMEMVSAAKMRKAVEATLNTRSYALLARDLLEHLAGLKAADVPFLEKRSVNTMLIILVSSNRGLCGSFNTNIFKKTALLLGDVKNLARHRSLDGDPEPAEHIDVEILGVGKKSASFAKRYGYPLIAVFDHLKERPSFDDILPITRMATEAFLEKKYDKVVIMFTEYKTSMTQLPKVRQLLPISDVDIEKMLAIFEPESKEERERFSVDQYVFEPNRDVIMRSILPRLVEIQLYQALLESSASEQSARMVAMKQASDAAGEMIGELTLQFNKGRQAAITQEIAEIAGGAVALG